MRANRAAQVPTNGHIGAICKKASRMHACAHVRMCACVRAGAGARACVCDVKSGKDGEVGERDAIVMAIWCIASSSRLLRFVFWRSSLLLLFSISLDVLLLFIFTSGHRPDK